MINLWLNAKQYLGDIITYFLPIIALVLSIWSFNDSRKTNKLKNRLGKLEEQLKKYELETVEKEREEATKACVEARIYQFSSNNYRIKFWNSGKSTAYGVDFIFKEGKPFVFKNLVPFEVLEPGKSFEEILIISDGTQRKYKVTTSWKDSQGNTHSKDQLVSR